MASYLVYSETTNAAPWSAGWWRQGVWRSSGTHRSFHTWAVRQSGSTADSAGAVRVSPWRSVPPSVSLVLSWSSECFARWRCTCWTDKRLAPVVPRTNRGSWSWTGSWFCPSEKRMNQSYEFSMWFLGKRRKQQSQNCSLNGLFEQGVLYIEKMTLYRIFKTRHSLN